MEKGSESAGKETWKLYNPFSSCNESGRQRSIAGFNVYKDTKEKPLFQIKGDSLHRLSPLHTKPYLIYLSMRTGS